MQRKENILEELRLISAVVAGIDRRTPYVAPDGYFDGLSDRVMGLVKQTPYAVPEGYFASFAEKLMARIKAGQEGPAREELAVLSPLLSGLDKKSPFQAPEGYFGELTGNIVSGVQAIGFVNDELENLSPMMTVLQQANVYEAPDGYFDRLPETVLAAIRERVAQEPVHQAPVISINRRSKWLRVASAAIVAGLILTAGWLRFFRPGAFTPAGNSTEVTANLAKASDQEIQNYLDNQNISLSEVLASNNPSATLDVNDTDVKNMLGDVSDDELQQYLQDNGSPKDPVTN